MTLITSNSIFQPVSKYIKINNSNINVLNGANTISTLPLCGVKMQYEQYQRLSVQIPKGQVNYVLSFPMLGIKPTFLAIIPKYCDCPGTSNLNYLKWKFELSSDPKLSFTNILVLTGTTANPITSILIDNPNPDEDIQIEILVSAMSNDYLNDIAALLYLQNLSFTNIHTYNETNSGILSFFNSNNELTGTTDISDIINVYRVNGQNRIIIDESSVNNIVLDFSSEYHTLQALSAINWLLLDPNNRSLPQPADDVAPTINYTPMVASNAITIELTSYPSATYTKQNFIDDAIVNAFDTRDGFFTVLQNNITFKQGVVDLINIVNTGTYNAYISVSDIAGNITNEIITITAELTIIDTTPPVINTTSSVTGTVVDDITLSDYFNNFTYNDAKVLCILNVIDDIDGPIALTNVTVQFLNNMATPVTSITTPGAYSIIFTVADSALNTEQITLTVNVL